jgi:predicted ArsR family transcriptional regulator
MAGHGERPQRTGRRRAVLDEVRAAESPVGVTEVAARLGVHPNTVRFHLDALVADGAVDRALGEPSGPGRPRTVYSARRGMDRGGVRGYRLLAQILVGQLAASGPGASATATKAGQGWGSYLVEQPPPSTRPTARGSVDRLSAMLADLGFDPQPTGEGGVPDRIRLRHCPFLELAEEHGQIVCALHLGLMQGALTALDGPVQAARLEPFAEPGACLAYLTVPTAHAR